MFTVHAVELLFTYSHIHLFKNWNKSVVKKYHIGLFWGETYGYGICGRLGFRIQLIVPTQFERKIYPDMEFVQNFTPPDFQAKNFTPSISPNFNSFSKKKHKKWVKMEKFTPLAKILHCRQLWRHGQIPPLVGRFNNDARLTTHMQQTDPQPNLFLLPGVDEPCLVTPARFRSYFCHKQVWTSARVMSKCGLQFVWF